MTNGWLLLLLLFVIPPRPFEFLLAATSGTPPGIGKMVFLGLEKGRPAVGSALLGMVPVTVLAVGWDPPRILCMKKDRFVLTWSRGFGAATWLRIVVDESEYDKAVRMKKRESGNLGLVGLAINVWVEWKLIVERSCINTQLI